MSLLIGEFFKVSFKRSTPFNPFSRKSTKNVMPFASISKTAFFIPSILISLEIVFNNLCFNPFGGATTSIKSLLNPSSFAKLSPI